MQKLNDWIANHYSLALVIVGIIAVIGVFT